MHTERNITDISEDNYSEITKYNIDGSITILLFLLLLFYIVEMLFWLNSRFS